jgi:hypothetical protein
MAAHGVWQRHGRAMQRQGPLRLSAAGVGLFAARRQEDPQGVPNQRGGEGVA